MKRLLLVGLCPVFVLGVASAQAVTIDLSSPQEGTVVHPGQTVSLTITVTNDTNKRDLITLTGSAIVEGVPVDVPVGYKSKKNLKPGQVWTQTISGTIPADLVLPGPVAVTVTGVATGKKSGTTASDSVSATAAP